MNRSFRSPNAGQTSLTLQHSTSPRLGYRPPAGHNADGYTNGGDRINFRVGGRVGLKEGSKKNWMQDVNKSIKQLLSGSVMDYEIENIQKTKIEKVFYEVK